MAELNEKGKKVFALKYSTGKTKTWKETCRKIADFIADGEKTFGKTEEEIKNLANIFYDVLYDLNQLPGGRIIANAGTGIKNLANCFVLNIEDSRSSIYQTLKDAADIFANGGGIGYSFSNIREEGALINTTGGKASGALSFMTLFDQTGEVIQQASRRGAQLASLNVNHPDIEKFIHFKSTLNSRNKRLMQEYDRNLHVVEGYINGTKYEKILEKTLLDDQLTHFNISVLITDDFMNAVKEDKDWDLISPATKQVVKTVKAKKILMAMAKQAHASGDPGVLLYDAINKDNLVPYIGDITSSNPCFSYNSQILTNDGYKCIGDLENKITKFVNARGEIVNGKVIKSGMKETIILNLSNGNKLECTPDHKLMLSDGNPIEAKDSKNKKLKGYPSNEVEVISIKKSIAQNVYDFQLPEYHWGVVEQVVVANCGEVPLLSIGESCILASINLHEMYDKKNKNIDYEKLKNTTKTMVRFLDDVTEVSEAPLEFINTATKNLRRIGGGVLGLADLLVEMNIPYDSDENVKLSEYLSWFINFHAWETSYELAKERGCFNYYDKEKANFHVIDKVLYENPYQISSIPREELINTGVRNVGVTSLAPTGSIAIIGGVNSGIEPFFALAYKRNITEGVGNIATDSIFETNPALERKLKDSGYDNETTKKILEYSYNHGTLLGCDIVSKEMQDLFKTANDIHWKRHVDVQAAWQKYVSNAISKTCNLPEETTVEEIYNIYMYMWESGLKGSTVYRSNSKTFQILEKPGEK